MPPDVDSAQSPPPRREPTPVVDILSVVWHRLNDRKVVQWTIGYVVVAAGLLQFVALADATLAWGGLPTRAAFLLFVFGLPLVLTFAWYHGDLGNRHVTRIEALLIAALVAAAGISTTVLLWHAPAQTGATAQTAKDDTIPTAGVSIAVLPFVADDPKNQDFADGFADELLTTLGSIKALAVPGRFSSFQFKGKNESSAAVAVALHVNHLLEGALRMATGRVEIRVRLIEPKAGRVLWSQVYQRELEGTGASTANGNLYQVESDIARKVANQLQVQLVAPDEIVLSRVGTADSEAHRLYLIGTKALRARTLDNLFLAKTQFEEAIKRDPNYAAPFAGLAQVHALLVGNFLRELPDGIDLGLEAAGKAVALDPNSGAAMVSLAALKNLRYATADQTKLRDEAYGHIDRADTLLPANVADAKFWQGFVRMYDKPNLAEARKWLDGAVATDPEYRMAKLNAATVGWWAGDADIGRNGFNDLITQYPDYSFAYLFLGWLELNSGRAGEALRLVKIAEEKAVDPILPYRRWQIAMDLGDADEAREALDKLGGSQFHDVLRSALKSAVAGNDAQELATLERAKAAKGDGGRLSYAIGSLQLRMGQPQKAAATLTERFPGLAAEGEPVNFFNADGAIALAAAWKAAGEADKAKELLQRVDTYLGGKSVPNVPAGDIWRAMAHAIKGDNEDALSDLNHAFDAGFRMLWFDRDVRTWHFQFVPFAIDQDPRFASLTRDPRFKHWIDRIRIDNAAQREALRRSKDKKADGSK